ncbi:hypothetical protein C0J52_09101 [Blattella germanica]|nr:hypothetical protein C0J52_09101 [Blattella germanica]
MSEGVTVRVAQGVLKGQQETSKCVDRPFFSFKGIPYAKPPVGPLRFKAPQPPESWEGVREALVEGNPSPHIQSFVDEGFKGDENCLFLNVFTPKLPDGENNPKNAVMVFIHGGGFNNGSGTSEFYGPDFLLGQDVLVVTINYRLGALGFLSTGDSVVPGNNGLKDQVMALRWIQQNVAQFGGDPSRVTIFGESAGLFSRAIAQSGSVLNSWAFNTTNIARSKAFRFGEALGCKTQDSKELERDLGTVYFRPTVEREPAKEEEVFLPQDPRELLKMGKFQKVPFIAGVNSSEGLICLREVMAKPAVLKKYDSEFELLVPLHLTQGKSPDKVKEIAGRIKKFYFGNEPVSQESLFQYVDLSSDCWFVNGINTSVKIHSASSSAPVFCYQFSYDGVCHCDELGYLFFSPFLDIELKPDCPEIKIRSLFVKMWTNFAKTGNPSLPELAWDPVTNASTCYMNIDQEPKMCSQLFKERMEFWDELTQSLPGDSEDVKKAVFTWIYWGNNTIGNCSKDSWPPDFFLEQDIVLVMFNYRLGPLGFLCTEDSELPGNTGLKDQVMALRWIQENISNIGGDPNNVTLGGYSTGAVDVNYHLVSPMSKGLFHRVIIQSGSTMNSYGYLRTSHRERAFKLGETLGFRTTQTKELVKFLHRIPPERLMRAADKAQDPNSFLTENAIELMETGKFHKVPVLIGFTNREGIYFCQELFAIENQCGTLYKRLDSVVSEGLTFDPPPEKVRGAAKRIRNFYFGDKPISMETINELADLQTDAQFVYGVHRSAKILLHHNSHPVYVYQFSFDGKLGYYKPLLGLKNIPDCPSEDDEVSSSDSVSDIQTQSAHKRPVPLDISSKSTDSSYDSNSGDPWTDTDNLPNLEPFEGVCHADDSGYMFPLVGAAWKLGPNSPEAKVRRNYITLLSNFIKTGNPTPEEDSSLNVKWKPATKEEMLYLDIGKELQLCSEPFKERMDFVLFYLMIAYNTKFDPLKAYIFSSNQWHENHAASLKVSCAVGLILNQSFSLRNSIAPRLEFEHVILLCESKMSEIVSVSVVQGKLRGREATTKSGVTYYSFQGIPYAKPPVGALRFKAPQPADSWEGMRDALVEGPVCAQFDLLKKEYKGEEDCLYLNVYTPKLPRDCNDFPKAVMVWIHGGGFAIGDGNAWMYGPDYLVAEDIVLVTVNYRLGPMGFLGTGDAIVPGNNGLKDQVMALRWVQQNIAQFGGDPGNVTIFGSSTGAACVHYHMLSPMSEVLGCKTNDSAKLVEFLRNVPVQRLVEGVDKLKAKEVRNRGKCLFTPTIEAGQVEGEEVFLAESPIDLMTQGRFHKVPYITGINSHEGLLMLKEIQMNPQQLEIYDKNFELFVRRVLWNDISDSKMKEIAQKVKEFYFGDKPLSQDTLLEYVDLNTDIQFAFPIYRHLKHHLLHSSYPVYCYRFSFDGKLAYLKKLLGMLQYPGVCHADEIGYLFQVGHMDPDLDAQSPEAKTRSRLVKIWTNFAKTGCPTPKKDWLVNVIWKPTTYDDCWYLNMDTELTMQVHLNKERATFWEDIFNSLEDNLYTEHSNMHIFNIFLYFPVCAKISL